MSNSGDPRSWENGPNFQPGAPSGNWSGGSGGGFKGNSNSPNDPWNNWGKNVGGATGAAGVTGQMGTTGAGINVPTVDPNAYQYGGKQGGAQQQNQYYQGLAGAQAAQQGAQIQNQYDPRDQAQVQGTLGQLGSFYQGQMNGTGPSLAAQQAKASMDQSLQAQMAAANSARGGLSGAAAQMQAAQSGAAAQQAAAQQSVQGRIQEEYNAAQGMQGVGQLSEGEQNINAQTAYQQAALQQQQQDINARSALGYAGLENQVNTEQMNAQMQQQAQMSGNYLGASGMGMNQSQFNTTNNENMAMGGLGAAAGLALAFADADLQEPGGDAHWTLREEPDFILAVNQRTGRMGAIDPRPLTDREFNQAMAKHGAGPLGGDDPRRQRTTFSDMPIGGAMMAPQPVIGRPGTPAVGPVMQQPRPAPVGGGMPMRPMPGAYAPPQQMAPPPGLGAARPMPRVMPDMDLGAGRHYHAHDADLNSLGNPAIQGQLGNLDFGASNAPNASAGGGTFADQMRAQEAQRIAAAAPAGGYTFAQQRYYPGAGGLAAAQPSEAAALSGGQTPALSPQTRDALRTMNGISPSGVGSYNQGWDDTIARNHAAAAAAAQPQGPSKLNLAGQDMMKAGISRMGAAPAGNAVAQSGLAGAYAQQGFTPMAVPSYAPPMADMDLGTTQRVGRPMTPARTTLGPRGMAYGPANTDGLRGHMARIQAADLDIRSRAPLVPVARFTHIGRQAHGSR